MTKQHNDRRYKRQKDISSLASLLLLLFISPFTLSAQADNDSSYWNNRFMQLLRWTYVDTSLCNIYLTPDTSELSTLNSQLSTYQRIAWYGYSFQESDVWPVVYNVALGDGDPQTLTLPALEQLAKWGAFLTNEDYRRQMEEGRWKMETVAHEADTLHYALSSFADSMEAVLLADSIAFADEQQRQNLERTKQRMKRDQIFFLNIKNARSQYMFGLEINLYNCFDKTISMLEFNVAPYNDRGRVQEDKFHRTVRTMRCMGPIQPDHPAQYTFDELFWDDRSRIKYMRINSITFYFTDGTSKSFNGYQNVMKHSLR